MLAEQAEVGGRPVLSRSEARAMRVHGLAERLSPGAGAVLALVGAVALFAGVVGLVVGMPDGPLASLPVVLFVGVGPALLSLSAAALARDVGVTTAAATVVAAVASLLAWLLAVFASLSWGSGFRQADLGVERTDFAAAFPVFFLGSLVMGLTALTPVIAGVLRGVRHPVARWSLTLMVSVPGVLVIGLLTLGPGSALLPALGLLVAWGLRRRVPVDGPDRAYIPMARSDAGTPAHHVGNPAHTRTRRRLVVGLALTTAVLGAPFSLYAVLGGSVPPDLPWLPAGLTQLPPMNIGLAGGAVSSLPLVGAAGLVATGRWGSRGAAAGLLICLAVLVSAVSAAMGPSGETQTYLLFLAGLLVGVAAVLPAAGWVRGPPALRWSVIAVAAALAGGAVGIMALAVFPLVAPVVAVLFGVLIARGPRMNAGAEGEPQPQAA